MVQFIKITEVIPKNKHAVIKQKRVTKHPWKMFNHPTMEFTTNIPKRGCPVDCVFCPQRVLTKSYNDLTILSLDAFKFIVDKIPTDVRITFAGFTEPFVNKHCADMVLYAYTRGHDVSVFTTGIGMSILDFEKIKDIPFADGDNGGFVLHLPDHERRAKHPITQKYKDLIKHISKNDHKVKNFKTMCMGELHPNFTDYYEQPPVPVMYSRANNLSKEEMLKPELAGQSYDWMMFPEDTPVTCACQEQLYHNVCLPNGDVVLCCMDYDLEHILGNLILDSYEDIVPEPYTCFEMCQRCENGVDLNNLDFEYIAG